MTTADAKPAGPAVEAGYHRLSALEGVAALSVDALLSVGHDPEATALPGRQLEAGS